MDWRGHLSDFEVVGIAKDLSPDGERTITFRGRVDGDEISFTREITVLDGGSRGGNDL
jgi:hypothetical protein